MAKRRKKKKNNSLIVIVILILIGYLFYHMYITKNKVKVIFNDNLKIEINSQVHLSTFVKEVKNGVLVNGSEEIDTSKLGLKKLTLELKDNSDKETTYQFVIDIVDTEKPIIEAKNEITTYVGRDIDLLLGVNVSDNSNEIIKPIVIGSYDNNKAGVYNLKYQAKDSSGNISIYDFILNIQEDENNKVFTTSKGFIGKVIDGVTYIDGILIANKSYNLPKNYGDGLTNETNNAFDKMASDAKKEGYNLYIRSGYRSYNTQSSLYNKYVNRDGKAAADTYSARAGYSEHQTGLAIDVCDKNVTACVNSYFDNTKQAKWISDNAYKYGLILRYPKGKESITGYMYESWHLRYVGIELASKLYNDGEWVTLEEYYGIDSKYSD